MLPHCDKFAKENSEESYIVHDQACRRWLVPVTDLFWHMADEGPVNCEQEMQIIVRNMLGANNTLGSGEHMAESQ